MGRVRVGVSPNERRGEIRSSAVVSTAVGVEALEGEIFLHPGRIFQCVWFQEGHNVILDRDVLAASYGQVLESIDPWRKHAANKGYAGDGGVAEIQARQPGPVWRYYLLQ